MTPEAADIQPVGAGLSRDISKGEAVEADLEAFITRRHDYSGAKEAHRPSEEMYEESTRRYQEQMHATTRVEWHLHHVSQAERLKRTLEALVEYHEEQAAKLIDVHRMEQSNGQGEIRQRLQGAGGHARAYEIPWPPLLGLAEDGRPCERAHGPRLDRRKVEVEMIYKRAANHWKAPLRFERRETEQEEESQPLRRKTGMPRSLKDSTKAKPRRAPWK